MPIKIPNKLPARVTLENEGVNVMSEREAIRQDIRPLQIGLLNLMPDKIKTETQIARLVGASPLQVELTLVRIGEHKSKNTSEDHLIDFYHIWEEVQEQKFDGFIVTGAPIELLPYEEVSYWSKLQQIMNWTETHVHSSFFVCWGAMAALYQFHNIPKYDLAKKAFGVFRHQNLNPASPYLSGFSDDFSVPVSRWTEIRCSDIDPVEGLEILMDSDDTGPCLLHEKRGNRLYIFNHVEYDSDTLGNEYWRDRNSGVPIEVPHDYFPGDNPEKPPQNRWRSHAHLLFGNWINQVYQSTPFDMNEIGRDIG